MIWLGILIDAIPESMVIGFIVSEGSRNPLVFVVGVFLSNFPEALASAATMKKVLCVRARVRVQAYMCVHTHIHTYTTYMHASIMKEYIDKCINTCVRTHTHTHVQTCMHTHRRGRTDTHRHRHRHTGTRARAHTHTHTRTHTHTQTQRHTYTLHIYILHTYTHSSTDILHAKSRTHMQARIKGEPAACDVDIPHLPSF